MTDYDPAHVQRQTPKRRNAELKDFTLLVRVSGQPATIRVFTAAETTEANDYATQTGGTVEPLP